MRFQKLLVANRGEIAVRIIRAAKECGLKTVAVYSEADKNSLHRREADEAAYLGGSESSESYLQIPKILEACKAYGAEAIHPGYGFLSEKAAFAEAVEKAGLIFVGPTPEQIDSMGDKVRARETMEKLGVPIVPGTGALEDLDLAEKAIDELLARRKDFRFPLLVKAAGGGGGKGMRVVKSREELRPALERAQSESLKAFGNPVLFVERYIVEPRHIEVQVIGDGTTALHVYERECSLQRRHQKVVEEAPSPSIRPETRQKMLELCETASQKMGYRSAGTFEFIVSPEEDFFFLEMNTRIQVEHPVTECISGLDLIHWQLRIAQGEKLSKNLRAEARGHAIEVRLYAEDPDRGFLPQPGYLQFLRFPAWAGIRVDSGVQSPERITSFYDPMIAKVISWAPDRETARRRLLEYLRVVRVEGLITNKSYLMEILESDYFKSGHYHTGILEHSPWRKSRQTPAPIFALACLKDYLTQRPIDDQRELSAWQREVRK